MKIRILISLLPIVLPPLLVSGPHLPLSLSIQNEVSLLTVVLLTHYSVGFVCHQLS